MTEDSPRWRNVHIVSDGTPFNTKITDETGKEILGIRSISIDMEVDREIAVARIDLMPALIDMDVTAEVVRFCCPLCGKEAKHDCKTGVIQNDK